jgi:hypothetical protein
MLYLFFFGPRTRDLGKIDMVKSDPDRPWNWLRSRGENRQNVLKGIRGKWGKFSEDDLAALRGRADLVTQLAAKYGIENAQAQQDVDAFLKGRRF